MKAFGKRWGVSDKPLFFATNVPYQTTGMSPPAGPNAYWRYSRRDELTDESFRIPTNPAPKELPNACARSKRPVVRIQSGVP